MLVDVYNINRRIFRNKNDGVIILLYPFCHNNLFELAKKKKKTKRKETRVSRETSL